MNRLVLVFLLLSAIGVYGQNKKHDFVFPEKKEGVSPMLNLRFLNEEMAGSHGFIHLSEDGESFMAGDQPIRFWPVNSGAGDMNDEELAAHAAFLAQMGVNMVRYHGSINPAGKGTRCAGNDGDRQQYCVRRCFTCCFRCAAGDEHRFLRDSADQRREHYK
jgi:hypothetical protein